MGLVLRIGSASLAGRHLRRLVKDADRRVAVHARMAVRRLGLAEVAARDTRGGLPRRVRALIPGGYNPSGWNFGCYRGRITQWGTSWSLAGGEPPLAPQAERAPLPSLPNQQGVASWLGCNDPSELTRFLRPGSATGAPYVDFDVPKATGGTRRISAPRAALREIQRTILEELLNLLPVHDAAHGFIRGRSTVTNAQPHQGAALLIKLDLQDFFPSIHYRRVRGLFRHYGYDAPVADLLAGLTTRRPVLPDGRVAWPGVLPQGAPTSPAIANLACRRLDSRLTGLARKVDAVYTRYADDLTLSFAQPTDANLGRLFWWIDQICQQEGFTLNGKKRRVLRPSTQQRVTGIVVNEQLSIPRRDRRRFRAILHNCRRHGVSSQARGRSDFADYLRGYASYARMIQPALGAQWAAEVESLLQP